MPYPALTDYLARLARPGSVPGAVWLNEEGQAVGRFFDCALTSAFQPVRNVASFSLEGYEGLVRGVSPADAGLSLWSMLDGAASDDESIELDRLCRMLHAINFFRQPAADGADLYLNVHNRLLGAVSSNHGHAFRRIFAALGLPVERVVLQLPAVSQSQGWLLNYVADNYSRNGFRLALNAASYAQALSLLGQVQPHAIRIDAADLPGQQELERLLLLTQAAGVRLHIKRVEGQAALAVLERAHANTGVALYAQGAIIDPPRPTLSACACRQPGPARQAPAPAAVPAPQRG